MKFLKKYQSLISLAFIVTSVYLVFASLTDATTIEELDFTFDAGIVLWFLYVIYDIVTNVLSTLAINRDHFYKAITIAWNVARNILVTIVLGAFLSALCVPVFEGYETEELIAERQGVIAASSLKVIIPVIIVYVAITVVVFVNDSKFKKKMKLQKETKKTSNSL